jgi:hypothetical protein
VLDPSKKVPGDGAFFGVVSGELAVFVAAAFTKISFLWCNLTGCLVVISGGAGVPAFDSAKVYGGVGLEDHSAPAIDDETADGEFYKLFKGDPVIRCLRKRIRRRSPRDAASQLARCRRRALSISLTGICHC